MVSSGVIAPYATTASVRHHIAAQGSQRPEQRAAKKGGRHRPGGHAAGVKGNGSKILGTKKDMTMAARYPGTTSQKMEIPVITASCQTDGNRHADGEASAHGLAGNGAGGDLLHLLVQNMDRSSAWTMNQPSAFRWESGSS